MVADSVQQQESHKQVLKHICWISAELVLSWHRNCILIVKTGIGSEILKQNIYI